MKEKFFGDLESLQKEHQAGDIHYLCTVDLVNIDLSLKIWFIYKMVKLSVFMFILCYFFGVMFKLVLIFENDVINDITWSELNEDEQ